MHAFLIPLALIATPAGDGAGAWPEFRGPTADGRSPAEGLPLRWSETENVRWKTPIHDRGWSTPVVLGRQVWLTTATADGKDMYAVCVDRETGAVVHDLRLFHNESPRPLGNDLNCYASPSPVIEPGRVWVSFGSYGTACLDTATGKRLWERRDLPCNHFRGPASSPVLFEGRLILHMDGSDHHYVVALDAKTGDTVWKTPRSTDYGDLDSEGKPRADGDFRKAFNTPFITRHGDRPVMISPAAKAAYGYDPRTGKELWQVRYPEHSSASRAVVLGDLAFINTGYSRAQLWAVRLGGEGDVTGSHVAWKRDKSVPNRPSPVLVDGRIYTVSDKGVGVCLDARTGEEVWVERIGGNYSASPVCADGRIWFFSHEGKTTVVRPGDKLDVVAENQLDDGFMASPAIAGKAFYLRTRTHLYRIEE